MRLKIKGQIFTIGEAEVKSEKFTKREMVIVEDPLASYPCYVPVECVNEDISLLDDLDEGQWVEIDVEGSGRLWSPQDDRPDRCFFAFRVDTFRHDDPIKILDDLVVEIADAPQDEPPF